MTTRESIAREIELRLGGQMVTNFYEPQPYTYLIGWKHHNLWYYGVRYAAKANPIDLWESYFTSSKYVAATRIELGEPDVIQVRRIFESAETAIKWESKVLRRLNVLQSNNWLNRTINCKIMSGPGKLNPMYGKRHSNKTIEKLKKAAAGKRHGDFNGMFGKTHTDTVKQRLSKINIGVNNNQFEGYFITPWGKFDSAPSAARNAPIPVRSWTINRWCKKENANIINKISKSKIIPTNCIGKTYRELGFGFERVIK